MTIASINGIRLSYQEYGTGDPVVLVTGTGSPGQMWRTHQVPALRAAGHRVITMDNRGIAPSDTGPGGFGLHDMMADVAGLIEHLDLAPCGVVGFSLGAMIVQELLVERPELVSRAVLIATAARTDVLGAALAQAEITLADSGVRLPPRYAAVTTALRNLSPDTLADEEHIGDWLDVLELCAVDPASVRSQLGLQVVPDRRPRLRAVSRPCLVIAFRDDLIARPHLGREVADSIPGAGFREIAGCGHYGCLEQPALVNEAIVDFLGLASRLDAPRGV